MPLVFVEGPVGKQSSVWRQNYACQRMWKYIYYTFELQSCFLLVHIQQFIPNFRKPSHHSTEFPELFDRAAVQKKLLDADDVTTLRPRKLQNSKTGLRQFGKLIARVFLLQIFSCIYRCFKCTIK